MKIKPFIYILLVLQGLFFEVQCQQYESWQLTIEDGLAHNTVECIFKDKEGFMWFGTHGGLNRYDGHEIKSYQHISGDSSTISGNRVVAVNQDSSGMMWVGTTRNGLNRFDKTKGKFYHYKSGRGTSNLPSNQILNIKVFDNGEVWVCTSNGLALYNPDTDNFINYFPDNLENNEMPFMVYDVLKSSSGEIYVATSQPYIYDLNKEEGLLTPIPYARDPALSGNYRKHFVEDSEGYLWISAFSHGLIRFDPDTGESKLFTPENSELNTDLLNGNLVFRDANTLWLSSDGYGIIVYDFEKGVFSNFESNKQSYNHIHDDKVYSLYVDEDEIVWVGTFNSGVSVLDPNKIKFSILTDKSGKVYPFDNISILDIFEDSKGRVWIGTDDDGLYQLTVEGELIHYSHHPNNLNSLSSNRIVTINEDLAGHILLGSYLGGLVSFNVAENKFTRFSPNPNDPNAIGSNHVWSICKDSENRIWIGLLGSGLDLYDEETMDFTNYGPRSLGYNRINHENVMCIIEDNDGDVWFGTEGMGITILKKTSQKMHYTIGSDEIQLANNNVRCIYEDSKGFIWIGSGNGGLNKYDKKSLTMQYYTMTNGLPSNMVESIVEDVNGDFWLGTAYGLSKFNPETEVFRNYDVSDGVKGFVCNRNAILKRSDGTIFVGTTTGLNVFKPDSIYDRLKTPKVFFTDLRIQNQVVGIGDSISGRLVLEKEINATDQLVITPKDKIFTIEFAAQTYTLPEKCMFQYKLDGFEKQWNITTADRQHATYSNLVPGNYTFQVKASNSDGVWSEKERALKIVVLPTFWRTIWFKLISLIVILFLFYQWYGYKIKMKDKQFDEEKRDQNQRIMHLEKENLESQLNNQTFNVLSRNKTLLKHKRRLSVLLNKVDDKNKSTLAEIIDEIDKEINEDKDWKHIEPRLDKVYNNFLTTLRSKHKDLTQNELKIAAYVRMGLSTKEISEIMQKTIKAIDNERYRLRKKLNILQNNSLKKYLLDL